MRRWAALAASCALVAAATPALAAESVSYAYLERNSESAWRVVIAGPDGIETVTVPRRAVGRPAIAPSGNRIVFAGPVTDGTDGRFGLYSASIDGSNVTRLTTPGLGDRDPAFSPDGSRIAFTRAKRPTLDQRSCCVIKLMDADGRNVSTLKGSTGGSNPAWSPDGTRIAYETPDGVVVTNLKGNQRIELTGALGAEPAFSPDGRWIVYTRPRGNGSELVVRPASGGTHQVRVTSPNHRLESPVWGEDSRTLFYMRHKGQGYEGRWESTVWQHTPGEGASRVFNPGSKSAHLARVARASQVCDVNGDGYADLTVGAPGDNAGALDAGAVTVLHGSPDGVSAAESAQFHRGLGGITGIARIGAAAGSSIACGDFDGDGFSDIAAGAPGDEANRGSVMVLYGSPDGLSTTGDQRWEQDTPGVSSTGEPGDRFGTALAAGDFDGDGYGDLAIGSPGDSAERGVVNVLYGSSGGLTASGDQLFKQGANDIGGTAKKGELFGAAVAAGDFDGDGWTDLAIGVPGDTYTGKTSAGSVQVIYGSSAGLSATGDQMWRQDRNGVEGGSEPTDEFGAALATGDFDGDGVADLAVGVPGEAFGDIEDSGAINVLYGSSSGLTAAGDQRWWQGFDGVAGATAAGDRFGNAVTAGDFDGDGRTDLAIGAPFEGNDVGVVNVLYGSTNGLTASGDQVWKQATPGVSGSPQAGDRFGAALSAGDFDGDGYAELVIAAIGERRAGRDAAGVVHIIAGSADRLTAAGDALWAEDSPGVPGGVSAGDLWGFGLR